MRNLLEMDTAFEYDVFISFASADEDMVLPIWQQLSSNGLRVFWSDESLKENAGKPFFSVIQDALSRSRHMLLVCTEDSMNSKWVKLEYETFYGQFFIQNQSLRRLLIYPDQNFDLKQLPPFLRSIQVSKSTDDLLQLLGSTELQALKDKMEKVELELNDYKSKYEKSHALLSGLSDQLEVKTKDYDLLKIESYDLKQQIFELKEQLKIERKSLEVKNIDGENSSLSKGLDLELKDYPNEQESDVSSIKQKKANEKDLSIVISEDKLKAYLIDKGYYHLEWNAKGKYYKNDFLLKSNNEVVFDKISNLTWQKSGSKSTMTFKKTKEYIDKMNKKKFGGASNWRLPTVFELYTLLKGGYVRHINYKFDDRQNWIWSSSKESSSRVWVIGFHNGACNHYRAVGNNFVRLVHD